MIRHKFNAKHTEIDGKRFPSKMEGRYYSQLLKRVEAGEILFFLRQIPFDLPGNLTYRADFMTFLSDGSVEIIDVKGMDTPISKLKRRQVEASYPVAIKIVDKC